MSSPTIEGFLDRLHRDPSFELQVRVAVIDSLSKLELTRAEGELLYSEGIARVELSTLRRAAAMQGEPPLPTTPRKPTRPAKPSKPKKPSKPSKPKKPKKTKK